MHCSWGNKTDLGGEMQGTEEEKSISIGEKWELFMGENGDTIILIPIWTRSVTIFIDLELVVGS